MGPELIVALDIPASVAIPGILDRLPKDIAWFKIGLELFTAEGPSAIRILTRRNKRVFLDLKFHDIPNTVARAVSSAAGLGVSMLTVHACGGRAMMRAASEAAKKFGADAPKLVGVTTLTSLDTSDFADIGISRNMKDQALALAEIALASGIDGVVTSVHEAESLRRKFGPSPIIVTPGIRSGFAKASVFAQASPDKSADMSAGKPSGAAVADQKRVATPAMAVEAGSDFLVVGRPILDAPDPRSAALAILEEMRNAKPPLQ